MNIDTLKKERLHAIKAKYVIKKNLLSTLIGELDKLSKEPGRITPELSEQEVNKAISKLIKSNQEILESGSGDIAIEEEISILEGYLPKQMSDDEIIELVNTVAGENPDVRGGKLIGICVKAGNGLADSKAISKLVMKLYS